MWFQVPKQHNDYPELTFNRKILFIELLIDTELFLINSIVPYMNSESLYDSNVNGPTGPVLENKSNLI